MDMEYFLLNVKIRIGLGSSQRVRRIKKQLLGSCESED